MLVGKGVSLDVEIAVGSGAITKTVAVGDDVKVGCGVGVAGGSVVEVITKNCVKSSVKIKKVIIDSSTTIPLINHTFFITHSPR